MEPLRFEADEAGFDINLPAMDDKSSRLGTIRSSASPDHRHNPDERVRSLA